MSYFFFANYFYNRNRQRYHQHQQQQHPSDKNSNNNNNNNNNPNPTSTYISELLHQQLNNQKYESLASTDENNNNNNNNNNKNTPEKDAQIAYLLNPSLLHDIDILGRFHNSYLQNEFIAYCLMKKSSFFFPTLLITIWAIAETIISMFYYKIDRDSRELPFAILSFFFIFASWISGFFLYYYTLKSYPLNSPPPPLLSPSSSSTAAAVEPTAPVSPVTSALPAVPPLSTRHSDHHQQQYYPPHQKGQNEEKTKWVTYQSRFQMIFLLMLTSLFIVKICKEILFNHDEQCVPKVFIDELKHFESLFNVTGNYYGRTFNELFPSCPSLHSEYWILSPNMVMIMAFCPLYMTVVLYEPRLDFVLILCLLIGTCDLFLVVSTTNGLAGLPILLAFCSIFFVAFVIHDQRIDGFINHHILEKMLLDHQRNADMVHANEMRRMIGNVAHDLKTPLSSFMAGIEIIEDIVKQHKQMVMKLQEESKDKTKVIVPVNDFFECIQSIQTTLKSIFNSNAFMQMSINRSIDYTKASQGIKLTPHNESVVLEDAIHFPLECMTSIQDKIKIETVKLSEEISKVIITDKGWLQENLLCLLSNAVRYSAEGLVTLSVKLVTDKQYSYRMNPPKGFEHQKADIESGPNESEEGVPYLRFEVEDHGIGLSDEDLENLFTPMRQAQRLTGGTGLGLFSLAKRVESIHGYYGVMRRRDGDHGSLFWFSIPYQPDHVAQEQLLSTASDDLVSVPPQIETIPRGLSIDVSFHGKTPTSNTSNATVSEILLVDDSPSILKLIGMMLKRQKYQITTAENGAIAVQLLEERWKEKQTGFDLILMDLQMPVMDGLEATKRIRRLEKNESTRPSERTDPGCEEKVEITNIKQFSHQLIFGVSANSDSDTIKEAYEAGIDDFIAKPFTMETFHSVLKKHFISPPL